MLAHLHDLVPAVDALRAGSAEAKTPAGIADDGRHDALRAGSAEAKLLAALVMTLKNKMHSVQAAPRQSDTSWKSRC